MEQKIYEENFENYLLLSIHRKKPFAVKSIQRSVFRNLSHINEIRLFPISAFFLFRFTMTKQTVYLNNFSNKVDYDSNYRRSLRLKLTTVERSDNRCNE